jgi:AcrR family transcriptional regulator
LYPPWDCPVILKQQRNNVPILPEQCSASKGSIVKTPSTRATKKSTTTKLPPARAHAKQNLTALLSAAAEVFATSGVDAPVREIAERACVGLGTVYRHFPQRSDLIVAVMQSHVEACADAAAVFAGEYGYVMERLGGALRKLLDGAIAAKSVRSDIDAEELLWTVATMCRGPYGEKPAYASKMVDVLIDGLRYGANS